MAVITVVYQNYDILNDLFASLQKQTNNNYSLFIADLSANKIKIDNPPIPHTVVPGNNKGYAHGINLCLEEAIAKGFKFFVVINSDVILEKKFIENCLNSITAYPGSIIGGKIYYAKGFEYHKTRYTPDKLGQVLWYAGGSIDWRNVVVKHHGVDKVDHGQFSVFEETGFIPGTLMVFDKTVIDQVGLWNERYFLYYEDADFCERARRHQIALYYNPNIIIWHKNAQSTGGAGSPLHQKYQRINRLRFGLKYAPIRPKMSLVKNYLLKKE